VDQLARLLANSASHCWMGVAQAADGNAGKGIEILVAVGVEQPAALATLEADREAIIGIHQRRC